MPFLSNMSSKRGFSLIELLVTIAIIAILASLTLPSLMGIVGSGNVNAAVSGISQVLDQARTYAMAHNTYVWVGFTEAGSPQELVVGVVAGTSGQSTDLSSSTTYSSISRIRNFNQMTLQNVAHHSSLSSIPGISPSTETDDLALSSGGTSFTLTVAGTPYAFNEILQYDPQGAATAINVASGTVHQVQIGLQPLQGNSTNAAVLEVATLTGQVRVFRP